MAIVDPPNCDS